MFLNSLYINTSQLSYVLQNIRKLEHVTGYCIIWRYKAIPSPQQYNIHINNAVSVWRDNFLKLIVILNYSIQEELRGINNKLFSLTCKYVSMLQSVWLILISVNTYTPSYLCNFTHELHALLLLKIQYVFNFYTSSVNELWNS